MVIFNLEADHEEPPQRSTSLSPSFVYGREHDEAAGDFLFSSKSTACGFDEQGVQLPRFPFGPADTGSDWSAFRRLKQEYVDTERGIRYSTHTGPGKETDKDATEGNLPVARKKSRLQLRSWSSYFRPLPKHERKTKPSVLEILGWQAEEKTGSQRNVTQFSTNVTSHDGKAEHSGFDRPLLLATSPRPCFQEKPIMPAPAKSPRLAASAQRTRKEKRDVSDKQAPPRLVRQFLGPPAAGWNIVVSEDWSSPICRLHYDPEKLKRNCCTPKEKAAAKKLASKYVRHVAIKRTPTWCSGSFLFGDGRLPYFRRRNDIFKCHYYEFHIGGNCKGKIHVGFSGLPPAQIANVLGTSLACQFRPTVMLYDGFLQEAPLFVDSTEKNAGDGETSEKIINRSQALATRRARKYKWEPHPDDDEIRSGRQWVDVYRQEAKWDGTAEGGDDIGVAIVELRDPHHKDFCVFRNGKQVSRNKFRIHDSLIPIRDETEIIFPIVDLCGMHGSEVKILLKADASPPKVEPWRTYKGADLDEDNDPVKIKEDAKKG